MIKDIMVFSLTSSCELTKKVCALLISVVLPILPFFDTVT